MDMIVKFDWIEQRKPYFLLSSIKYTIANWIKFVKYRKIIISSDHKILWTFKNIHVNKNSIYSKLSIDIRVRCFIFSEKGQNLCNVRNCCQIDNLFLWLQKSICLPDFQIWLSEVILSLWNIRIISSNMTLYWIFVKKNLLVVRLLHVNTISALWVNNNLIKTL